MAAEKAQPNKKTKTPFAVKFSVFLLLVAGAIFLSTSVLFIVCMVPTLVAMVIDRQPQKTMWITIGAMNLAGTLPSLFSLWQIRGDLNDTFALLTHPLTMLMAYGAAALGWVIHQNFTPFVASVLVRKNQIRLKEIEKRQKELVRKWGEDVG